MNKLFIFKDVVFNIPVDKDGKLDNLYLKQNKLRFIKFVGDQLKNQGWKFFSFGSRSHLYSKKDRDYVIKVVFDDSANLLWMKRCIKIKNYNNIPYIHCIFDFSLGSTSHSYIVIMEKLEEECWDNKFEESLDKYFYNRRKRNPILIPEKEYQLYLACNHLHEIISNNYISNDMQEFNCLYSPISKTFVLNDPVS
jgi:hypothetical protein